MEAEHPCELYYTHIHMGRVVVMPHFVVKCPTAGMDRRMRIQRRVRMYDDCFIGLQNKFKY